MARLPLPTALGQFGSVLQEFHCPLPLGNEAVHSKSSAATAHRQCGSLLQGLHYPLPLGSEPVHCRSSTVW